MITDLFEAFLQEIPGQSPYSLRNYRQRLRHLLAEGGGVEALTRERVNEWHKMILGRGFASATVAGYRQALKSFCAWLVKKGHLEVNPADHLRTGKFTPERGVHLPDEADVVTVTALARLWVATGNVVQVRRGCAWLYVLESGARRGGVTWLPLAEVRRGLKYGSGDSYRFNSREKTGQVVHVVGSEVAEALEKWLRVRPETDAPQCFISTRTSLALQGKSLTNDFYTLCQAAGVGGSISPHALRHRVGDLITRTMSPKVAQLKLNHADITTTLLWYHDARDSDLLEATAAVRVKQEGGEEVRQMAQLFGLPR